jgi:hypothetical protein
MPGHLQCLQRRRFIGALVTGRITNCYATGGVNGIGTVRGGFAGIWVRCCRTAIQSEYRLPAVLRDVYRFFSSGTITHPGV